MKRLCQLYRALLQALLRGNATPPLKKDFKGEIHIAVDPAAAKKRAEFYAALPRPRRKKASNG